MWFLVVLIRYRLVVALYLSAGLSWRQMLVLLAVMWTNPRVDLVVSSLRVLSSVSVVLSWR